MTARPYRLWWRRATPTSPEQLDVKACSSWQARRDLPWFAVVGGDESPVLFKLYVLIVGDTTGVFLFVRVLLVAMFGLVGWSAYALARLCIPRPAALLVGTMCMCFIPYSMPGLSYLIAQRRPMVSSSWIFAGAPDTSMTWRCSRSGRGRASS